MTPLFKKLNYKDQKEICIVNHPPEFVSEVSAMQEVTSVKMDTKECRELDFILAFVTTKAEVESIVPIINNKLQGDGTVWFAYPKGTSKKYKAQINRDNGWKTLGDYGYEGVRAVAIDED